MLTPNQYQERQAQPILSQENMAQALPKKGKVSRNQALAWGVFLGVIGLGILQLFVNTITMVLTFISLIGP
jgi:protoheme IX farnesyltransferase